MTPPIKVIAFEGAQDVARYSLETGEYTIGRSSACALQLKMGGVSREHARLRVAEDGSVSIEDAASANGTFVDGDRVSGSARVLPNQTIQLGNISLLVQQQVEFASAATADQGAGIVGALPPEFRRPERYEVGAEIARGGMGAVLNARQVTIRRPVALKRILGRASENPKQRLRFIEEAQITGQLEHPNIVPVYDLLLADENGQPYYTMKLVQGITLKKILQLLEQDIPETVAKYPLSMLLTVFQKVCDAVAFAHSKGVIHRDLKPANVMVGYFGEVLVMDWGLAKIVARDGAEQRTSNSERPRSKEPTVESARRDEGEVYATLDGAVIGTPHYMSPEQARGEIDTMDARSDIFALGVILYEILTLTRPFAGKSAAEITDKIMTGEFVPPAKAVAQASSAPQTAPADKISASSTGQRPVPHLPGGRVPESLDAICRKALAHDRAQRYPSVNTLQTDLTAYQTGFATSAESRSTWKQMKLLVRRNKAASIGIAAVLLVGTVLGTGAIVQGRRAERALADLKRQAPALQQLAESEEKLGRFESALEKLDAAIAIDPEYLPSYWHRVWLLIGLERFQEAAGAGRRAQQKDPANIKPAAILPLLDRLAASSSNAEEWPPGAAGDLFRHLEEAGAFAEIGRLSKKLRLSGGDNLELTHKRVKEWLGTSNGVVSVDREGLLHVNLYERSIDTIAPLRGLPVQSLNIAGTRVSNLEPLREMPLQALNASGSKVVDLAPLAGMPLVSLNIFGCPVEDLSPLQGMPLAELNISRTKVRSLEPLGGRPLRTLDAAEAGVTDLSPLRGAPLERLNIFRCPNITSFAALEGMPLTNLNLIDTPVPDLSFLKECPIESLAVSGPFTDLSPLRRKPLRKLTLDASKVTDLSPLRGATMTDLNIVNLSRVQDLTPLLDMSNLKRLRVAKLGAVLATLRHYCSLKEISYKADDHYLPAAEFWAEFDAEQAAGKK